MEEEVISKEQVVRQSQSLLLTDRLNGGGDAAGADSDDGYENSGESDGAETDEEDILGPAETMDVQSAKRKPYGLVVELDYVSANKISFHGNFGYMVFVLEQTDDGEFSAVNTNAVTLEELGGITMGGIAYTDVLAGDGCALIVPGIHNEEIARRRKFLYIEETNEITGGIVAPSWMMEKMANNDYVDAVVNVAYVAELTDKLRMNDKSKLLYGPVEVPETDSNIYGFLAENGESLEDIWYGLWNRDLDTVTKIRLFE